MAITEDYAGTEAVGATEWSMTADSSSIQARTTSGVYQAFVDVAGMAATNILRFRVYEKAQSGTTQRVVYESILTNAQVEPIWVSPSLILMNGWDFTATAVSGTITIYWSIRKVA